MHPRLLIALVGAALAAGPVAGETPLPTGVPPSPATATGERVWPAPRFTHWPAIAYRGEARNLAFAMPVPRSGVAGAIGWRGGVALPFALDVLGDRAAGLIDLPDAIGAHVAELTLAGVATALTVRLADVRAPWPLAALVDGFPVDDAGTPTVLIDQRRDPAVARRWELLSAELPRPAGRPLLVGDPLEALGDHTWRDVDAEQRVALDERHPHHAALVALARLPVPLPRTIVWSPGNQALFAATWTPEEERVLAALHSRCEALGALPRLVLVLPPVPVDAALRATATRRRELLGRSAAFLRWIVLDVERLAGPAESANRVADGVTTRYALGEAQARVRAAIAAAVAE